MPFSVSVASVPTESRSHNSGQNGHVQEVRELIEVMTGCQQLICHRRRSGIVRLIATACAIPAAAMQSSHSMCFAPRAMQTVTRRVIANGEAGGSAIARTSTPIGGMEHECAEREAQ
ncbi:hypothetical protein [Paraburkholderia diazotrophica]|uniref:hypothetical protein n=1 Tax=Paraburkholderia diazotrophica TaxID=667676 RepID=UPI0015A72310|nr:hypothetical protein [Paraburkholderia diazotrophica]